MPRLASVALLISLAACSATAGDEFEASEKVSKADFGEAWPLTVETGTVACDGSRVVFITDQGTIYAVNGSARTFADEEGWVKEIDPIWATDPDGVAPRKNIGPIIDKGLALCGQE